MRRPDGELPWVERAAAIGSPVLLDTTVYIDTLQGRSPAALDAFISFRTCNHSSVCPAQLAHAFGRLSPSDPRTDAALKVIGQSIRAIPAHRLVAPDAATWGTAGILAGILFRLGSHAVGAEQRSLNDALVYLQGASSVCQWSPATSRTSIFLINSYLTDGFSFTEGQRASGCRLDFSGTSHKNDANRSPNFRCAHDGLTDETNSTNKIMNLGAAKMACLLFVASTSTGRDSVSASFARRVGDEWALHALSTPAIDRMSWEEKLRALEEPGEAITREGDHYESPAWHGKELKETRQCYEAGAAESMDWAAAKREFRR